MDKYKIDEKNIKYFLYNDTTSNYAYKLESDKINIQSKSGKILDIVEASDQFDISILSKAITKHYICYPKDVDN